MSLTDASLTTPASFLISDLASNGCQAVATSSVSDFQSAYNASSGAAALSVDGYYGAGTSSALQAVIDANQDNAAFAGETAPAGCVGQAPPHGGGGGANPPMVVSSGSSGSGALPYIVGAIVVAGALAAYTYSHKKGRRR